MGQGTIGTIKGVEVSMGWWEETPRGHTHSAKEEEEAAQTLQYSHCRPKDTMMSAGPLETLVNLSGVTLAQTCRAFSMDWSTSAWDMSGL